MKHETIGPQILELPQLTRIFRAEAALIGIPDAMPEMLREQLSQGKKGDRKKI